MAFRDYTGQQFGKLTVIKRIDDYVAKNGHHHSRWLCRCSCGKGWPAEDLIEYAMDYNHGPIGGELV